MERSDEQSVMFGSPCVRPTVAGFGPWTIQPLDNLMIGVSYAIWHTAEENRSGNVHLDPAISIVKVTPRIRTCGGSHFFNLECGP